MGRPPIKAEGAMTAAERMRRKRSSAAEAGGRTITVTLDAAAIAALDAMVADGAATYGEAISAALTRRRPRAKS